jgi:CelD/BcsL family acetyltransferase involved in cellulose biosynthesis
MPHVLEINDPEQLEQWRVPWTLMVSQTRGASFFHTLDWLQCYWKHFGATQCLRVLVVSRGGTPLGILPLTVVPERTRLGTLRTLTYPLHDWGTFFGPRDWDLLDIRWVNRDLYDHLRTPSAMEHAGYRVRESTWKTSALIEFRGDWNAYWRSRSSKMRSNLQRDLRHLEQQGSVEHVRHRPAGTSFGDDNPRWDYYDSCVGIAAASWQGSSQTGTTLSHPSVASFFREAHALAVRNGMVDLNLLRVNGETVAYSYNYVKDGHLTGIRRGHLPSYAPFGAGNVMCLRMVQDSFERQDASLDLGPGWLDIKRRWSTRLVNSYRYTHYPWRAPRSQLLRLKHWMVQSRSGHGITSRPGESVVTSS